VAQTPRAARQLALSLQSRTAPTRPQPGGLGCQVDAAQQRQTRLCPRSWCTEPSPLRGMVSSACTGFGLWPVPARGAAAQVCRRRQPPHICEYTTLCNEVGHSGEIGSECANIYVTYQARSPPN
jgi:hypothetical protein